VSHWPSCKAKRLLKALEAIGWRVASQTEGSHKKLVRGNRTFIFSFHDREEIGPKMLARVAKHTGLRPEDL
jgi:predicted RNA binding protein YcfA (HicA-like mRNA interferase family)